MTDERIQQVTDLLREAGELHHAVYRIADGDDPDWPSWYADWLLDLSELPEVLGNKPVRSELIFELVSLGREYESESTVEPWQSFYAARLVQRLGG